jgi:DNA modification methylase
MSVMRAGKEDCVPSCRRLVLEVSPWVFSIGRLGELEPGRPGDRTPAQRRSSTMLGPGWPSLENLAISRGFDVERAHAHGDDGSMARKEPERGTAKVDDLVAAPYNPRTISNEAMSGLKASIKRFGLVQEIVVNRRTGYVVGGHQRIAALKAANVTDVPVVWVDLSDRDEKALNVALNNPHIAGEFTPGLQDILEEVQTHDIGMFEELRLDELLVPATEVLADGDPDEAPEVEEDAEPSSALGEVYELGPHRLVCGDSTDAGAWAALLGDERLQMVWTDPPYGVSYVSGRRDPRGATYGQGDTLENDSLDEEGLERLLRDSLGMAAAHCKPGSAWYVAAPPGPLHNVFGAVLKDLGIWRRSLVWLKDQFVFGRGDYHYRHEPIFYGWVPGAAHYFTDDRTQDTILEVPRPQRTGATGRGEHPTMKPIELVARCIRNSSKPGWVIGEPFGGSGTTLLAAAKEGRVARVIELDPKYCDVIRRRWTRFARENGVDPGPGALD